MRKSVGHCCLTDYLNPALKCAPTCVPWFIVVSSNHFGLSPKSFLSRNRYDTPEEERHRFSVFVENLKAADERNAAEKADGKEGHAVHGITRYVLC